MILTETAIDFKSMEQEIYKKVCEAGRELVREMLESYDSSLSSSRDRASYRHKGKRKTTIKTVMGEVEYHRAVYEITGEDGGRHFVYLLDEAMGRTGSGYFSGLMSEIIAKAVCEGSYRSAARSVSELSGQTISHTAAWNVAQELGKRADEQENRTSLSACEHCTTGTQETKLLFEEQDGIWLNLQGQDRKTYGQNREMKVAIAYDGAKKVGEKRYELTNKVACANFESVGAFQKRKEGVIAEKYNTDEIEMRFLNGDGAQWIRQAQTDETVHFQLDPFHRNKAIRQWVKNDEMRKQIMKLLYDKEITLLLEYIEALTNSVEDESEKENLISLLTYFTNNKDGLVPCHRRGLALPQPPEGVEYRHMGVMESNIFTLIGNRMKGRRACWSVRGGNNLARLLCLKHTGRLSDALASLSTAFLPAKYAEEITVNMTVSKTPKADGKGYESIRGGTFPAAVQYKWLREICKNTCFIK